MDKIGEKIRIQIFEEGGQMSYTIDVGIDIPIYSPICTDCANLKDLGARTCLAFPVEIPMSIWKGERDHNSPYKGDNGIMYVKKKGSLAR